MSSFEQTAAGFRNTAAPLFEEEWNARFDALVTDVADPVRAYRAELRPTLSTDNHPVDSVQRQVGNRSQQRFDRKEANNRVDLSKSIDAPDVVPILDGYSLPDIRRPVQLRRQLSQTVRPFGENLKVVPVRAPHHVEDGCDK